MSLFGKKEKVGNIACNFIHVDGINGLANGSSVTLLLDEENKRILFDRKRTGENIAMLSYKQLCGIKTMTESEVHEATKSVIGRAAVGGVLLGPLGAIVGGMSGVGTKKNETKRYFVVINYHPSSSPEETCVISLEPEGFARWDTVFLKLKEECESNCKATVGGYL